MHVDQAADDRDHPYVAGGVHTKEAKEADRVADYLVVVRAGARAEEDDRAAAVKFSGNEETMVHNSVQTAVLLLAIPVPDESDEFKTAFQPLLLHKRGKKKDRKKGGRKERKKSEKGRSSLLKSTCHIIGEEQNDIRFKQD
ncbi:hypothetical protein KIN20_037224 [Parelaphostrongylus tenuis]|uniref:Uncharacterized protein n=1 Tax=Parelaphostrongylus tenuis TaxID=148309 RepID=A0AAD5RE96_PARTN|nr:hypothetical protein KIN20_037224 [Parelaphostrongylus tenuis]